MFTLIPRQVQLRLGLGEETLALLGRWNRPGDLALVRQLAEALNDQVDLARFPEKGVRAGELNALRLWVEVCRWRLHRLFADHPKLVAQIVTNLEQELGEGEIRQLERRFVDHYSASRGAADSPSAGEREESMIPPTGDGETAAWEGMVLLWVVRKHPAAERFRELLDDSELQQVAGYRPAMEWMEERLRPLDPPIFAALRPPSTGGEVGEVGWEEVLTSGLGVAEADAPPGWRRSAQVALGVLQEESKPAFTGLPPGPPPEVRRGLDLETLAAAEARFSADRNWMLGLVLIAKNVFVWLDQLSQAGGVPRKHLDDIPGEELDRLAGLGVTGLWLIGVWQRSAASERIKKAMGNPEAAASAYSLFDYQIAEELGGEEALDRLRSAAAVRGIRLACDMVPNHFGIDSRWVHHHPERFLSTAESPFPGYRFTGEDLSSDPRVGIFLEDGYYRRSDAAVVFQRVDRQSGEVRYVYHGNDGTALPWNDTAQLDYLRQETRAAVVETILEVAERFPIIRFDAAMTLARQHIQRLWFPPPGEGGAIPSRAERGMSRKEFEAAMPEEFWRQVVEEVEERQPGTLLLAEAFWLMEGFFVRTLGMHRVYNSAFMHLLREGENEAFLRQLREVLEADPQILQRFVNYVTNPDEGTAAEQLGKGDRYFGICTLLVTLPGTPMLGHGQLEGFREKYGMEYRRAYGGEAPDRDFLKRHEGWIVPLLKRRRDFAEAESFRLLDFDPAPGSDPRGGGTYAYATGLGTPAGPILVLYNNSPAEVRGRVHRSALWREEGEDGEEGGLLRTTVGEILGLLPDGRFCTFRDLVHGLEFFLPMASLCTAGVPVALGPFEVKVLSGFEVRASSEALPFAAVAPEEGLRGVASLEEQLRRPAVAAQQGALRGLLAPPVLRRCLSAPQGEREGVLDGVEGAALRWAQGVGSPVGNFPLRPTLERFWDLARAEDGGVEEGEAAVDLLVWILLQPVGEDGAAARAVLEESLLGEPLHDLLRGFGMEEELAVRRVAAIKGFTRRREWWRGWQEGRERAWLEEMLRDPDIHALLGVHRFDGVVWFRQEGLEEWLRWLRWTAALRAPQGRAAAFARALPEALARSAADSQFQVARWLSADAWERES